jgi:lysophospholipase L1-like esterase
MTKILRWTEIRKPGRETDPDHGSWRFRIMAEGDSWFTLGGLPEQCNLLQSLDLPNNTIIVSLAKPGDKIRSMAKIWENKALHQSMDAGPPKFGYDWDLILLSGGGNDLIEFAHDLIKPLSDVTGSNAGDFVRLERLDKVLRYIQQAYRNIVALRDGPRSTCANKPVIAHTYDYATPRDAPAEFFKARVSGPWLFKALVDANVPENMYNPISDFLVDSLAESIRSLQTGPDPLPNFHAVDTRGILQRAELRAKRNSNDWLNEIHPNREGYDKLAPPLSSLIRQKLGV